jgi:hypothetical protein
MTGRRKFNISGPFDSATGAQRRSRRTIDYPNGLCTHLCTGDFHNSFCDHDFIKAEGRISINDYRKTGRLSGAAQFMAMAGAKTP